MMKSNQDFARRCTCIQKLVSSIKARTTHNADSTNPETRLHWSYLDGQSGVAVAVLCSGEWAEGVRTGPEGRGEAVGYVSPR